jgi:hypothetical protein
LELTLIEVLYRDTLLAEEYDYFEGHYKEIEEFDVDRWTLAEALSRGGGRVFYAPATDEDDFEEWRDPGIESEEAAERANAAMRRLRERYGSQDRRYEEDWWE